MNITWESLEVFYYYILESLISHSILVVNLQIFGQLHQTNCRISVYMSTKLQKL